MARYFTRPKTAATRALWVSDDLDEPARAGRLSIDVPEHEATDTGILDARGETIWRAPRGMGFLAEMD